VKARAARSGAGVVAGFESGAGGATFLTEVVGLLWPGAPAAEGAGRREPGVTQEILVLPNTASPRLLLPLRPGRVARAALTRHAVSRSGKDRLVRAVAGGVAQVGLGRLLSRDKLTVPIPSGVEQYLSGVLGTTVVVGVHLGPPRANRKPVLQVLDDAGRTLAYAKVGVGRLSDDLIRREGEALERLAGLVGSKVRVPSLLHTGEWQERPIVVQSALPVWEAGTADDPGARADAMRAVSQVAGTSVRALAGSPFAVRLQAAVDAVTDDAFAADLRRLTVALLDCDLELTFGSWHGDWSPGNTAYLDDHVLLWDWERFAGDVPLGMDAVHFALQEGITRRALGHEGAARDVLRRAPELLEPFGVPASAAGRVAALTLVELGARYAGDGQAAAGARLGQLDRWLVPAVGDLLADGLSRGVS
jgi:hypothetical protein